MPYCYFVPVSVWDNISFYLFFISFYTVFYSICHYLSFISYCSIYENMVYYEFHCIRRLTKFSIVNLKLCVLISAGLGDHFSASYTTAQQVYHGHGLVSACTLPEEAEAGLRRSGQHMKQDGQTSERRRLVDQPKIP